MKRNIIVSPSEQLLNASITPVSAENGIDIYRVHFTFKEKTTPAKVTLFWSEDMVNIRSWWSAQFQSSPLVRQWFGPSSNISKFATGAPIMATIGNEDKNHLTVAVSDVVTPINMSFYVDDLEQKENVYYKIEFFTQLCPAMESYTADIRVDSRNIPFYESIMAVSPWWENYGHIIPPCSSADEEPLYSSWYNYHQYPKDTELLADLKVAAQLGFKTLIIDDGWQLEGDSERNYSMCGEWKVSSNRFADMKAFVRQAHELGIKVMLWFGVPFIGLKSPVHASFLGKYLYSMPDDTMNCSVLDPRFPEVRKFLVDIYAHFLKEYDLDGFKLDFIDSIRMTETASTEYEKMDCIAVEEGTQKLLTEITQTLNALKPGLMFEFRQNYIGPAILKYGTMLRVGDCAYGGLTNRTNIASLRLLNYPIAVHSDMLFWSKKEPLELCAKQLLDILFAVPQISIKVSESPEAQNKLVGYYVNYWSQHKDILLHGTFKAAHPEMNYSRISSENSDLRITVLYAENDYAFDGKNADVFNAGNNSYLLLDNPTENILTVKVLDCTGTAVDSVCVPANAIVRIPVPVAGLMQIRKN